MVMAFMAIKATCAYCDWSHEAPGDTPLTSAVWLSALLKKHIQVMHPERVGEIQPPNTTPDRPPAA